MEIGKWSHAHTGRITDILKWPSGAADLEGRVEIRYEVVFQLQCIIILSCFESNLLLFDMYPSILIPPGFSVPVYISSAGVK